jgi:succinoglycan biosynthesis protein ExoV
MEVVYHRDPNLNFGDDLNEVLWQHVLPKRVQESERLVLVGIGSILNEEKLARYSEDRRQVVVLGTGTSYGLPPSNLSRWLIKAVRGPMTAALIGHPEASVTDGAALLTSAPGLLHTPVERRNVLFMPHHSSLSNGHWGEVAKLCGFDYASPQMTVAEILAKFAHAKLVVTEAMHGAIVADTLRIPWIPVAASPGIDEFKWRDWTRSLDLPFKPLLLPPSSGPEVVRHRRLAQAYRACGVGGFDQLYGVEEIDLYRSYLHRRAEVFHAKRDNVAVRARDLFLRRALSPFDPLIAQRCAAALTKAASASPFLSGDRVFSQRLNRLQDAVGSLEAIA